MRASELAIMHTKSYRDMFGNLKHTDR